jgi:glycosyltransferase involved in cell wall biosynthesis
MPSADVMTPGIVLLNRSHFPDHLADAFRPGATSFAMNVVRSLRQHGLLLGLVLHRRNESIAAPVLEERLMHGLRTITLDYHAAMGAPRIRAALQQALSRLTGNRPRSIVFHHNDTLLPYQPAGLPSCVTRPDGAVDHLAAVDAGAQKVHLARERDDAAAPLGSIDSAVALQRSALQLDGVPQERAAEPPLVKSVCLPLLCPQVRTGRLQPALLRFLDADPAALVLVSDVARIDEFRSLDLIVGAAVELMQGGTSLRVIVTGGDAADASERRSLRQSIPAPLRHRFLITRRLDRSTTLALFRAIRGRGLFVCTSRYETLGASALEAALAGVCTLSPDVGCVEYSRFFPTEVRYHYSVPGLARKIEALRASGAPSDAHFTAHLGERISRQLFEQTFMARWRDMSRAIVACEET